MRQNVRIYSHHPFLPHAPYDFMSFALSLVRAQVLRVPLPVLDVDD